MSVVQPTVTDWTLHVTVPGAQRNTRAPGSQTMRVTRSAARIRRSLTVIVSEEHHRSMRPGEEHKLIAQTAERLATGFPTVPRDDVLVIVQGDHVRFDGRPLREFVPLLVERAAKERLKRLVSAPPSPGPQ